MSLSSAWPPCTITAVALISAAASQVSCRILRDGMRMRLLAEATLIRYGAWTYSGTLDAFSVAASSRGLGFFQLCGLPRKNCTTSAPSAWAAARGSSWWTCEPMSTTASLVFVQRVDDGCDICCGGGLANAFCGARHRRHHW